MRHLGVWMAGLALTACLALPRPAEAEVWVPDSGRLLATGGISALDGSGGGGLATWALITGYGSEDSYGANAHATRVRLSNFEVRSVGAAIGIANWVEVSYAHLTFDTLRTGGRLGLGNGFTIDQDAVGVKIRLFGDAVYDQDSWVPQVSVGALYRTTNRGQLLGALGARDRDGVDYYVAATKLFLDQSILVNGTVRATRANQFGILGFGGDRHDDYRVTYEGTLAYLPRPNIAVGVEYRTRPDNLSFSREEGAFDVFGAWFVTKNISLTAAYVNLGEVATRRNQQGLFLSLQAGF